MSEHTSLFDALRCEPQMKYQVISPEGPIREFPTMVEAFLWIDRLMVVSHYLQRVDLPSKRYHREW